MALTAPVPSTETTSSSPRLRFLVGLVVLVLALTAVLGSWAASPRNAVAGPDCATVETGHWHHVPFTQPVFHFARPRQAVDHYDWHGRQMDGTLVFIGSTWCPPPFP